MTEESIRESLPPPQMTSESAAFIGRAAAGIPAQPEGESSTWLREREAESSVWLTREKEAQTDWRAAQEVDIANWARRNDVAALLEEADSADPERAKGLEAYVRGATLAQLVDPALEGAWQHPECRAERYKRILAAVEVGLRSKNGFSIMESRLFTQAFSTLGLDREARNDIFAAWRSYDVRLKKYHNDYKKRTDAGLQEGDIVEEKLQAFLARAEQNFNNMDELYSRDPETLRLLYTRDGIRNFGRYDPYDLYRQFLDPRAAGVVISDAVDWNGGLDIATREGSIRLGLIERRYMEARSAAEAKERLRVFVATKDETTGRPFGLIEDLVVNTHSDAAALAFGNEYLDVSAILAGELVDNTVVARRGRVWLIGCDSAVRSGSMSILDAVRKVAGVHVLGARDKVAAVGWSKRGKPALRNRELRDVTVRRRPPLSSYVRRRTSRPPATVRR